MTKESTTESPLKYVEQSQDSHRAILLTCYMTGADQGANLGTPGYSYDFVARVFAPLLAEWGELIPVPDPESNLEVKAREALERGLDPIHVSFLPFQDAVLSDLVPNIVVPAWEFPDIPNYAFDDDQRNDWNYMGNRCASVIVGGQFTKYTFEKGGIDVPINIVPVPTPEEYFQVQDLQENDSDKTFDFTIYDPRSLDDTKAPKKFRPWWQEIGRSLEILVRGCVTTVIGTERRKQLKKPMQKKWDKAIQEHKKSKVTKLFIPCDQIDSIPSESIIYTSIFNPGDGRKNWLDLISAFQYAMADHEDAVLIVKLITSRAEDTMRAINFYRNKDIPSRCKVFFVTDFLSHEQMVSLAEMSTYYIQTTKAEGNCLPLMNFFAAGRPGISPCHTAIADYFEDSMGFKVESHPEPCAWPHDPDLRFRTTWQRIVWPSLVDQIKRSYEIAKNQPDKYREMSESCRKKMQNWSHETIVRERLMEALDKTFALRHGKVIENHLNEKELPVTPGSILVPKIDSSKNAA